MTSSEYRSPRSQGVPLGSLLETGTVPVDSPFYIERDADRKATVALESGAGTVVIKGYRQSGKSSLLLRLHAHGISKNWRSCYLNLQALDPQSLSDTPTFFRHLAWMIADELDAIVDPDGYWSERLSSPLNLTRFVEQAVLPKSESAVQILFDEVDMVFQLGQSRIDFFTMIRNWHNSRAIDPEWEKLRLVLSHATDPALWIPDVYQSPFNIGLSLTLADFDLLQIADLNRRYGEPLRSDAEIRRLAQLLGGHPYLVRLALWTLVQQQWRIDELENVAQTAEGPFAAHLDGYGRLIAENPELAQALRRVLEKGECDEQSFSRLWVSGLVRRAERGLVVMRSELYRDYFEARRSNL